MQYLGPKLQSVDASDAGGDDLGTARLLAERIQLIIATAFERMESAGGPLRDNTTEYTQQKIAQGFDIRRGHRTGELQSALYEVPLWSVRQTPEGAVITWSDAPLLAAVPHAQYYLPEKVPGGSLASVTPEWFRAAVETLDVASAGEAIGEVGRQAQELRGERLALARRPETAGEQIAQQAVLARATARREAAVRQLEATALGRAGLTNEPVRVAGTRLTVVNSRRQTPLRRVALRRPNAAR